MADRTLERLLALAALGDRRAFDALYRRTSPALHGLALRVLQDRAEAEAAVADAYVKIWRYAERYAPQRATPSTWMIAITRNLAIERLRARRSPAAVLEAAAAVETVAGRLDERALAAGEGRRLMEAIRSLGEGEGRLVRIAYFGGLTPSALAERDGVPLTTVDSRMRRALAALAGEPHGTAAAEREAEALAYVLALLDRDERRRFEAALLDDPSLAESVWRAEERLAPLAAAVKPRPAPPRVKRAVDHRLFEPRRDATRRERRRTRLWRVLAGVLAAAAAAGLVLLAVLLVRPALLVPSAPALVAAIVAPDGAVTLARLGAGGTIVAAPFPPAADGGAELWLVPEEGDPVPLGPLSATARSEIVPPPAAATLLRPGARLRVTRGTGDPAGAVIGTGTLTDI